MENLSKQDQEFVKEVAITGNQSKSAKIAYGIESDAYARKKGSVQVAKGNISTAITEVKRTIADSLTDEMLIEQHTKLFNQKQVEYFVFSKDMENEEIEDKVNAAGFEVIVIRPGEKGKYAFYSIPNTGAITKGLEMAYKIKGTYAPEKSINLNVEANITDSKARELAEKYEEELKKNL